jgi:hypothetical protein
MKIFDMFAGTVHAQHPQTAVTSTRGLALLDVTQLTTRLQLMATP